MKTNSHCFNIEIVFDPVMALFNGVLELKTSMYGIKWEGIYKW